MFANSTGRSALPAIEHRPWLKKFFRLSGVRRPILWWCHVLSYLHPVVWVLRTTGRQKNAMEGSEDMSDMAQMSYVRGTYASKVRRSQWKPEKKKFKIQNGLGNATKDGIWEGSSSDVGQSTRLALLVSYPSRDEGEGEVTAKRIPSVMGWPRYL